MNKQSQWKSSTGFILASAGSAIGLGAMWKFPYMAGIYGGGAFFVFVEAGGDEGPELVEPDG